MRTHLFVAPGSAAFGEVLLGMRLARELQAAGDRVLFLAPAAHDIVLSAFPHGHIDKILGALDRALPDVIRDRGCDTVVLLDLLVTLLATRSHRIDPSFLDRLPVPTFALDIWDLRASDLRFDMCDAELVLPELAKTIVPRRLVPVPFARPDTRGAYCALPETKPPSADARARVRGDIEKLVVLTTARFQARGLTPAQRRAVETVLPAIAKACHDADPRIHLLHIGAQAIDGAGPRYRFAGQLAPDVFEETLGAADLLITPNQAATGISTAMMLGVPALCVIGPDFRVFPLGLRHFMDHIVQNNPYVDATTTTEISDLVPQIRSLLFEPAREAALVNMRSYLELVRGLPSGIRVMEGS